MKTTIRLIFALTCFSAPLHADALNTTPSELKKLEALNQTNPRIDKTDKELEKMMVGTWTTGRHDYVYQTNSTWQMLPIIKGGTKGKWEIKNGRLHQDDDGRIFLQVNAKQLVLKNSAGKYPFRYVRIKP